MAGEINTILNLTKKTNKQSKHHHATLYDGVKQQTSTMLRMGTNTCVDWAPICDAGA